MRCDIKHSPFGHTNGIPAEERVVVRLVTHQVDGESRLGFDDPIQFYCTTSLCSSTMRSAESPTTQ